MPATAPLPASITDKLKTRNQSVRWAAILREVREYRAYCCNIDSDNIMGVQKEPVVILTITPNPVCLGNAISADFTGSYAPGSSITNRRLDFGDSTVIDPAGVTESHTYATAGTFTVTATLTEGTGITQIVTQEVNVIDCTDTLLLANIYAATDGSGVWYFE
jgi:PKD repeat protein